METATSIAKQFPKNKIVFMSHSSPENSVFFNSMVFVRNFKQFYHSKGHSGRKQWPKLNVGISLF